MLSGPFQARLEGVSGKCAEGACRWASSSDGSRGGKLARRGQRAAAIPLPLRAAPRRGVQVAPAVLLQVMASRFYDMIFQWFTYKNEYIVMSFNEKFFSASIAFLGSASTNFSQDVWLRLNEKPEWVA